MHGANVPATCRTVELRNCSASSEEDKAHGIDMREVFLISIGAFIGPKDCRKMKAGLLSCPSLGVDLFIFPRESWIIGAS